jgi:hypothetical protein
VRPGVHGNDMAGETLQRRPLTTHGNYADGPQTAHI